MEKTELLDRLQESHRKSEAFLDEIDSARFDKLGLNDPWSVKDLVAHLIGWNRNLGARLQAAQRSEPEPPPPWPAHLETEDEINARIYESNRGRSVGEVLDEMRQVHQRLISVIEGLSDDVRIELIEPKYLLVWVGNTRFHVSEFFDHFQDDHEPEVRARLVREKSA